MVEFFTEDIEFHLQSPAKLRNWVEKVIELENHIPGDINYIFTSDEYLLSVNLKYLNHNSYTDIITFDQSSDPLTIAGDIFISVQRVRSNSEHYQQSFEQELKRVMIHGILHLIGYKDKSLEEKAEMRKKEEAYLSL